MSDTPQTIIVTGASSGIGLATSHLLLEHGYQVIGISRSICEDHIQHDNFTALGCDLTDFNAVSTVINLLLKEDNVIDGIVFCAGQGYFGGLEQLNFSKIEYQMKLNLLSPMFLSKLLTPYFKTRRAGRLVFIGSEAALKGTKNGSAYCASKFGLRGFTQALSAECATAGVNISLINPGMVDTPFFDQLSFEPGKDPSNSISAKTVAKCILNSLKCDSNTLIEEINLSPRIKAIAFKIPTI